MDPVCVKKRLEDYDQLLQYYIPMKTKRKMKDFDAEFEEWWEVIKEYFSKELENNLAQHRANEKMYKYKLEIYQKVFPNFVCGSAINIQTLGQDEENEIGPKGTSQEEVQVEEPWILKGGGQEDKKPQTLEEKQIFLTVPCDCFLVAGDIQN